MNIASPHVPVMAAEVVAALSPRDGATYLDATFGAGGYTRAILDTAACAVWAIDRDPDAIARGNALAREYSGRLTFVHGRFGDMFELLSEVNVNGLEGIALDLGVSSMQIDDPARGFSFRADGPLDMRMGQEGPSAADVINEMAERELADVIFRYGEEWASRRIARAIVQLREREPITRTTQLAEAVRGVMVRAKDGIDPATRTFQALRIYVNDELGELGRGLRGAERLLAPGGKLAVVSFHSLEDREVKRFLRERSGANAGVSRHAPARGPGREPSFNLPGRSAIKPGAEEVAANPRARSARLRVAERTSAPAWREEY
ncbi:MAG: 16S rRNA (cytosine(1402)-N(4))-methyltransferase RsmH [Rhodospirillales bacterium]